MFKTPLRSGVLKAGLAVCAMLFSLTISTTASAALLIDGQGGTPLPGGRPLHHNSSTSYYYQVLGFRLGFDATVTGIQAMIGGVRSGAYAISIADPNNLNTSNNLYSTNQTANLNLVPDPFNFNIPMDHGQYMGPTGLKWFLTAGDYWLKFTVPLGGLDGFLRSPGHYNYLAGAEIAIPGRGYQDFGQDPVAVSIYGFAGRGGVPEPATWAVLMLGFGVIGAALRGRRASRQASYCA
jgi:PEP-CTERM motif